MFLCIFHLQFTVSDIPLVTTAYITLLVPNNDPLIYTDNMDPFTINGLTIQKGINYTVTGYGENILGNGTNTSIMICML